MSAIIPATVHYGLFCVAGSRMVSSPTGLGMGWAALVDATVARLEAAVKAAYGL